MDIYDYVLADTLGEVPNEQITLENEEGGTDYIELTKVIKSGDSIWLKGYSHITGDAVDYCVAYDKEVGLWAV